MPPTRMAVNPCQSPTIRSEGRTLPYRRKHSGPNGSSPLGTSRMNLPSCITPAARQLAVILAEQSGDDAKAYELPTKARTALRADELMAKVLGKLAYRKGDYRYAAQALRESPLRERNIPNFPLRCPCVFAPWRLCVETQLHGYASGPRARSLDPCGAGFRPARFMPVEPGPRASSGPVRGRDDKSSPQASTRTSKSSRSGVSGAGG